MEAVRDDARQHFAPVQLGVAIPGGAEAAVHTARAWYDRNKGQPGKVLVKLDFKKCLQLGVSAGCAGRCGCSLSCSDSLGGVVL